MNTTFHMPGIDRACTSLALTSSETALHVRIGSERLRIPIVCTDAINGTLGQLRRRTIITFEDVCAICAAWNGAITRDT